MKTGQKVLQELLEHLGENIHSFANNIGLKRSQNLYDIESGKVKKISYELSEKIVTKYPSINKAWLLTGEGDMLLPDLSQEMEAQKKRLSLSNPFPENPSKEWAVIELLVQELAVDRSQRSARSVVDCLQELYAKIDLLINDDR